jgi:predicted metalloprotease with PDZ domain
MAHYTFSYTNPSTRLIHISAKFSNLSNDVVYVQLPSWRPGRYELGNFAQNIISFKVFSNNKELKHTKVTKDKWQVEAQGCSDMEVRYTYYAADLNAGSTFLCDDFMYANPVNCCVYVEGRMNAPCTLQLDVPQHYEVAIGLPASDKFIYRAEDFHQLADSPFIAGTTLQHKTYQSNGTTFYIWFNGKIEVDWNKVLHDFKAFTDAQFEAFGSFPFPEFHFLNHILPYSAYHGVEHLTTTVITLGPSEQVMTSLYDELLGISSHELYHCWNIKTIRPEEMLPYDYTRENYSRLGYVAEGVTTYMGDQMLLRSHVFTRDEWKKTFDQLLERHFQNFGRFNMSVADSSFDTWLDGYKPGAPHRKTSIYTEGALCAFMADMLIRKKTGNENGLDTAMHLLYERFGKNKTGYNGDDYRHALETASGISFKQFFADYYYGTADYEPLLRECLQYIGCELKTTVRDNAYETAFGFKALKEGNYYVVKAIYPGSEAEQLALELNDKMLSVNGNEMKDLMQLNESVKLQSSIFSLQNVLHKQKEITLSKGNYYKKYAIERIHEMDEAQARNFAVWAGVVSMA